MNTVRWESQEQKKMELDSPKGIDPIGGDGE